MNEKITKLLESYNEDDRILAHELIMHNQDYWIDLVKRINNYSMFEERGYGKIAMRIFHENEDGPKVITTSSKIMIYSFSNTVIALKK